MTPLFAACWSALLLGAATIASQASPTPTPVPRWSVYEMTLTASKEYAGQEAAPPVTATFHGPGGLEKRVSGFWDGGATFRVRFAPTREGSWTVTTTSPDSGLNHRRERFTCAAPLPAPDNGGRGFLRLDLRHPEHFFRDDGTPFFLFGQTYYGLADRTPAQWKESIDGTRRFGMNKIRLHIPADDGKTAPSLSRLRNLDALVRYAGERGVIADLIVFGSGCLHPDGREAADAAYLRYILARYAAFSSVAWTLTNEWNYRPKPRSFWNEMGRIARKEDPWSREGDALRALSIHQQTRSDWQFFDQSWPSHVILQVGVRNGQPVSQDDELKYKGPSTAARLPEGDQWGNAGIVSSLGHGLPVVNDEYGYIGEPEDKSAGPGPGGAPVRLTRAKHRAIIWGIYTAGGYGSAGDKYDYPNGKGRPYKSGYWEAPAEYGDIRRLVDFFTAFPVPFSEMKSRNDLLGGGKRVYLLAKEGAGYVAYAACGGTLRITLAPGNYAVRRFDPATGDQTVLATIPGDESRAIALPEGQDWVVTLTPVP